MTLIEVLVASSITVVLMTAIFTLLHMGQEVWQDADTQLTTVQEARRGMNTISLDLMRSGWTGGNIQIDQNGDWINFLIPQSVTSTAVTWGDQIRYQLGGTGGTQLLRENLTTGQTDIAANFINSVSFGTLPTDPNVITVRINAQKTSLSTRVFSNQLQVNLAVRN